MQADSATADATIWAAATPREKVEQPLRELT